MRLDIPNIMFTNDLEGNTQKSYNQSDIDSQNSMDFEHDHQDVFEYLDCDMEEA